MKTSMKKEKFEREITWTEALRKQPYASDRWKRYREAAQKVKPENRERALQILNRKGITDTRIHVSQETRLLRWKQESAKKLALKAGYETDEHGTYQRGDHLTVLGLDFVPPYQSKVAPYMDMGGEGLGLIKVERTRVYSKSSNWRPSSVSTYFLVGKNETGTYFSHPVVPCTTILGALEWIWSGHSHQILARQGDIALIQAPGPKLPPSGLPRGHLLNHLEEKIQHNTHPDLSFPGKGERAIVAKRAAERSTAAVRD